MAELTCRVRIYRAIVSDSVDATHKQPGAAKVAKVLSGRQSHLSMIDVRQLGKSHLRSIKNHVKVAGLAVAEI